MRRDAEAAALGALLAFASVRAAAGPAPASVVPGEAKTVGSTQLGFALDLYRWFAGASSAGNLGFSPYSIYTALAMTAEGARGETADEMGRALHLPPEYRWYGADASARPWDFARVHAGLGEIAAGLRRGAGDAPVVEARIDSLTTELAAANEAAKQAFAIPGDWKRTEAEQRRAEALAGELNALLPQVRRYELRVANALWGDAGYPFAPDYVRAISEHYDTGGVRTADFQHDPEGARREINDWIAGQTNQRIRDLLSSGQVTPLSRLVLANATWFKGEWAEVFKPGATREAPFRVAADAPARVPLMVQRMRGARYGAFRGDGSSFPTPREVSRDSRDDAQDPALYPGSGGFQLVELPYKGGEISMAVLLPHSPEGLQAIERHIDGARLTKWLERLEARPVTVFLPRFRIEQGEELSAPLRAMGMVRAFIDPAAGRGAQFGGMTSDADAVKALYVGAVAHRAFIDVDEKGTEAAAATAVIVPATAAMPPPTQPFEPTFRADRPFLFLIRDVRSGAILFMGRFAKP